MRCCQCFKVPSVSRRKTYFSVSQWDFGYKKHSQLLFSRLGYSRDAGWQYFLYVLSGTMARWKYYDKWDKFTAWV